MEVKKKLKDADYMQKFSNAEMNICKTQFLKMEK